MKTIKKLALALIMGLAFASCENNVEQENAQTPEVPCLDQVSYKTAVTPLLENYCLGCHSGSQFPDLRTYENVTQNAQMIKQQVVSRSMPLGATLTNQEIEVISCWVDQGAKNN